MELLKSECDKEIQDVMIVHVRSLEEMALSNLRLRVFASGNDSGRGYRRVPLLTERRLCPLQARRALKRRLSTLPSKG